MPVAASSSKLRQSYTDDDSDDVPGVYFVLF